MHFDGPATSGWSKGFLYLVAYFMLIEVGSGLKFLFTLATLNQSIYPFVHLDDPATSGCSKGFLYLVDYCMLIEVGSGLKFLFTFAILNRSVSPL